MRFFLNSITRSTLFAILSILIRVYTICYSQQSDQFLHCLPFSAVCSVSTLFIISVISVYTICHSQQSDQGLHYFPFFLSSIITVYTIRHSQQSDQSLHYLPFSAVSSRSRSILSFSGTVWSGSTLFAFLSSLIKVKVHCQPENSLIRIYSFCHSQPSDHGLHYFPFFLSSIIKAYTVCHSFLTVLSRSTLLSIFSCLIMVYTICHSQQSDQGLHYLPFFLNSIITVYTVLHSQQSDQGLHYLSFSAVSSRSKSTLSFSGAVWSVSTLFAILSRLSWSTLFDSLSSLIKIKVHTVIFRNSLIRVYTIWHSQQSDQGLHCLPFSVVGSESTLFAIFSSLNGVYTICHY